FFRAIFEPAKHIVQKENENRLSLRVRNISLSPSEGERARKRGPTVPKCAHTPSRAPAQLAQICRGLLMLSATLAFAVHHQTFAQAVAVTASLDTNVLVVGQSTTLRIFAQVLPAYRTNADRIFSWYVDLLNTNGAAAQA